jgi:hypothetical protein
MQNFNHLSIFLATLKTKYWNLVIIIIIIILTFGNWKPQKYFILKFLIIDFIDWKKGWPESLLALCYKAGIVASKDFTP